MKNVFFFLFLAMSFMACSGEKTAATEAETPKTAETETTSKTPPTTSNFAPKYKLKPFSQSPMYADAKLSNMQYKGGKVSFDVANYDLGAQTADAEQKMCANSGKGQHIHFIVDNEPYMAKYEANFEVELTDGVHRVLAFLSRSYHESIKTTDAHMAKTISVKDKTIQKAADIKDPMLFYSRPKGTYTGKANTDKVMLDFYPVNVELSMTGYKVRVNINGEQEEVITKWQPYFIEGLPMGDNKITLTLVDKDNKQVDTPLNPVTRTFTLQPDPIDQ